MGGAQPGLVYKWRLNLAASDQEKAFMQLTPLGGMIRNLAMQSEGSALHVAEEAAPVIALELAVRLVDDLIRAARLAAALHEHHLSKDLQAKLQAVSQEMADERQALQAARSRSGDLAEFYTNVLKGVRGSSQRVPVGGVAGREHGG